MIPGCLLTVRRPQSITQTGHQNYSSLKVEHCSAVQFSTVQFSTVQCICSAHCTAHTLNCKHSALNTQCIANTVHNRHSAQQCVHAVDAADKTCPCPPGCSGCRAINLRVNSGCQAFMTCKSLVWTVMLHPDFTGTGQMSHMSHTALQCHTVISLKHALNNI